MNSSFLQIAVQQCCHRIKVKGDNLMGMAGRGRVKLATTFPHCEDRRWPTVTKSKGNGRLPI